MRLRAHLGHLLIGACVLAATTVLAGTAQAAAAPAVPATAVPATAGPGGYVALGDSYTAGPLIPLPELLPLSQLACVRSTGNYPNLVAATLRPSSFQDASCSGADTSNMTTTQTISLDGLPLGSNPPQFDALRPGTRLVTLGIGGNDDGVFGSLVGTCPSLRAGDPTGAPCQAHFTVDGVDTLQADLVATGHNVAAVIAGIHQRSPRAKVLVIGYPRIVPPTGTCPSVIPFADGDYHWADEVEQDLDAQVAAASAQAGATFVDTYGPSLGHDACAGAAAWINGQNTNLLAAAAYHPFESYMVAVTGLIAHAVTGHRVAVVAG